MEVDRTTGGKMANRGQSERRLSKPSRKLFEQECKRLENEIHVLRQKLSDLKQSLADLFSKLEKLKLERDQKFSDKAELESAIKMMTAEINKLSAKLGQLQSQIHYRDMRKLEDAIRKLQKNLDSHHFKLSEEKKIVAEIDKLNRSRKVVGEFLKIQADLNELRCRQQHKRAERDKCVRAIAAIRREEESTKAQVDGNRTSELQFRADMESKYEEKKELKAEFAQKQQEYAQQKETLKEAKHKQQCQKPEAQRIPAMCITKCNAIFQRQRAESEHKDIPVCMRLIDFCQKVTKDYSNNDRTSKRNKKKSISYTPDVLTQFLSLGISPPITIQNAETCIDTLHQKIVKLRSLSTSTDIRERARTPDPVTVPVEEVAQLEESTEIEESVPATDEVDSKLNKTSEKMVKASDALVETLDAPVKTSYTPKPATDDCEPVEVEGPPQSVSRQSSCSGDLMEPQQPDDSSDVSDYSKQLSASSDTDPAEQAKSVTSILDSIVQEAEVMLEGQI